MKLSSRQIKWRLLFTVLLFGIVLNPNICRAHQTPNTNILLDVSTKMVAVELQIPISELELSFGHNISKYPEAIVTQYGGQLKEYLKAHIHAYINKEDLWGVEIVSMNMDKGTQELSEPPFWELRAHLNLVPNNGEDTRRFMLDYDVVMHQVMNHTALVSIRNDWENGVITDSPIEVGVISRDMQTFTIKPFEINLKKGSWFKGFKAMLVLGMQHIKEGTDHLLFLLVLLLPAMLLANGKRWGGFGGTRYSIARLLKIVTAFTIGHSITLLIGALGWMHLPAQPVEVLIAISILVSAIHAIRPIFSGKEMYVAADFGLVHGLAFASVLAGLHLSGGAMALSILGFNMGIELMQLFVIAIIVPWLILLSRTPYYKWFRTIGAILAGIAAIAWVAERVSGKENMVGQTVQSLSQYAIWGIIALAVVSVLVHARNNANRGVAAT